MTPSITLFQTKVRLGAKVIGAAYEDDSSNGDEQRIRLKLANNQDNDDLLFDKVIFASPAGCCNDAVAALMPSWGSPTAPPPADNSNGGGKGNGNGGLLGHFRSHTSEIVVHSDKNVMPKYKYLWASWTVRLCDRVWFVVVVRLYVKKRLRRRRKKQQQNVTMRAIRVRY